MGEQPVRKRGKKMAQSKEMTSGACLPLILNFAIPLLLGNLLQQSLLLGRFGYRGKVFWVLTRLLRWEPAPRWYFLF